MNKKVLIICSNYYKNYALSLKKDTETSLKKLKIKTDCINVPGVFEIPVVIARNIKKYDGFIALGCVIKGETPHFEFISRATINALMYLTVNYKKPIGNGIITALNHSQAKKRAGRLITPNLKDSKGKEAALAVIQIFKNES